METKEHIDGEKIQVKGELFTISNLISFSRALIPIPIIALHYPDQEATISITILIIYAFFSDYLDGWAARKFNQISEFGKVLDPLADKIAAVVLFLYLVWLDWVPVWFFAFLITRDALILIGSLMIKRRRGKVAMSTISGKLAVNVLAAYGIVLFFSESLNFNLEYTILVLKWGAVVLLTLSFIHYFQRFLKIRKGAEFN